MIADIIRLGALYVITRVFVEIAMPSLKHIVRYLFYAGVALTIIGTFGPVITRFVDDVHSVATTYSRSKEAANEGFPGVLSVFKGSWRIPMKGELTQSFKGEEHHGIDIGAPEGTPVVAVREGDVTRVEWSDIYGNMVVISHGKGIETLYGHLLGINVKKGDPVTAGKQIGTCGSTGNSTGSHLHFEIRINGTCVDPAEYLK